MYHLHRFGTYELPDRMPSSDISTGAYVTDPFNLSDGGAYDPLGTEESVTQSYNLSKTAIFYFATEAARRTFEEGLRALVGTRDKLYREWDNGDLEWVTARFKRISGSRELENRRHLEVDMEFEVYSYYWHGAFDGIWTFDAGFFFDSGLTFDPDGNTFTLDASPKDVTIDGDGNAIVKDVLITLTAGSLDITAFDLESDTGAHFSWSGTLTAGDSLAIDTGALTVLNNGVDGYANFTLESDHALNEWFRVVTGDNVITVTITGGDTDSTLAFGYFVGTK